ncbi:hypothetical protein ACFVJM_39525 [Streptomyces virginiae]|uniref:hypothetical protein n=1 Tax=Streptomyces virginiae TaxID=1961 RepID=UPI003638FFFF
MRGGTCPTRIRPTLRTRVGTLSGPFSQGGDPETWPLIVWPRHADQGPPLGGGLIDTLLDLQRGTLAAQGFAGRDEDDDPVEFAGFEPWEDSAFW